MVKNQPNESDAILDDIVTTPYKYGFTTNLETEEFEKGLNKEILEKNYEHVIISHNILRTLYILLKK